MQPHVPFEFDGVELPNAGVLRGSLVLGMSILGLDLKKDVGLNETLRCSTGITGQSSGLGMWVVPTVK